MPKMPISLEGQNLKGYKGCSKSIIPYLIHGVGMAKRWADIQSTSHHGTSGVSLRAKRAKFFYFHRNTM